MTRPHWLAAALERHAPEAERRKDRSDRARLQAALRSDKKSDREAASAELAGRGRPAKKRA